MNLQPTSDLAECEAVIERGLSSFVEVGSALLRIRDGKLYKASHKTFEVYCKERWGMGRHYANKTIAAASVVGNLVTMGTKPESERHVRPPGFLGSWGFVGWPAQASYGCGNMKHQTPSQAQRWYDSLTPESVERRDNPKPKPRPEPDEEQDPAEADAMAAACWGERTREPGL